MTQSTTARFVTEDRVLLGPAITLTTTGTLAAGRLNIVDATAGAFVATLPTPTRVGQPLSVEKSDVTANAVIISGTIRGATGSVKLLWASESLQFIAESLTSWRPGPDHKTKAALDLAYAGTGLATLRARLDLGLNATIAVFSDSTADDNTDWPQLWEALLGASRPELTVINRQWNDTSQVFGTVNTIQTGSATAPRVKTAVAQPVQTLTVYCGAVPSTTFAYQASRVSALLPVAPDLVILSSSHNYTTGDTATYTTAVESIATQVLALYPTAAIALMSQNPEFPPRADASVLAHAQRNAVLRPLALKHKWGYVPVAEAFLALADRGQSIISSSDGIHPTTGANSGQALWAATVQSWFTTSLNDAPTIPITYTDEQAQDAVAALFAAGTHSGITFTYDDAGNAISATVVGGGGSYTDEQAQDAIAALIAAGAHSGITFTYNDASNSLSATVTASSVPVGQDAPTILGLNPTVEETVPRQMTTTTCSTATGRLTMSFFTARNSTSRTQVIVGSGSTAAGATPSLVRVGLYELSTDQATATLVASITSDTALFATANTLYTKTFSSAYTTTAGKRYGIGILVVTAATIPNFPGSGPSATSVMSVLSPVTSGWIGSQADLPASVTMSALSGTNGFYARVL